MLNIKNLFLTSIFAITTLIDATPSYAIQEQGQLTPVQQLQVQSATAPVSPDIAGQQPAATPAAETQDQEKDSKNIFQKAGDGIVKGAQAVGKGATTAWNATSGFVSGIFKGDEPCTEEQILELKEKATNKDKIEKTKLDKSKNCIVSKCAKNYVPNDAKSGCEQSGGPCPAADIEKVPNATAGELKKGSCYITECGNGYHPSDNGKSCEQAELSEEDSKNKVSELKDNAQKMKDKEQSTANKLLGGAAIGATGIGGMNLMSGMAEQKADDAAEEDMKAYLATFVCDYGQGRNIKGGERNIDLPGGNELFDEVNEYKALAADLKTRKEALGKTPGIEAEVIYDIAETGLYDNVGMGRQSGAYASLSKALMDENSEDAKAWAKQKADAASKVKTGAITAGIGAVGGLVGNLAINGGEKNKNQVDKIISDYDKKKRVFEELQVKANNLPTTRQCSEFNGATGTFPNCTCSGNQYFSVEEGCIPCDSPKTVVNNQCKCPDTMEEIEGVCQAKTPGCELNGLKKPDECSCIEHAIATNNVCTCDTSKDFVESNNQCICPSDTHVLSGDSCVPKQETPQQLTISLNTDTFFDTGKYTLSNNGYDFMDKFILTLDSTLSENNLERNDITEYYTCITGHTDRVKFRNDPSNQKNFTLSENRAKAVKNAIYNNMTEAVNPTLKPENISYKGLGPTKCTNPPHTANNDPQCRKVNITIQKAPCEE
ncbi:MAG: OmpA family protein [Alphaproteobacteria bacterium]|nr:OmpA family protein [Alphaproteobacteria bacterium]